MAGGTVGGTLDGGQLPGGGWHLVVFTDEPGRAGDAVLPPVLLKALFGEFAAQSIERLLRPLGVFDQLALVVKRDGGDALCRELPHDAGERGDAVERDGEPLAFAGFGIVQSAFLPNFAQRIYPDARLYLDWDPQGHRLVSTFLDPNFAGAFILLRKMARRRREVLATLRQAVVRRQ